MQPWVVAMALRVRMKLHAGRAFYMAMANRAAGGRKSFAHIEITVMAVIVVMLIGIGTDLHTAIIAVKFQPEGIARHCRNACGGDACGQCQNGCGLFHICKFPDSDLEAT